MLVQALPRSLILVGMCYSSGFQALGVCRVLSVGEKCLGNCGFGEREVLACAVGPLILALIRTVLEMRTAIGKCRPTILGYMLQLVFQIMFMHLYFSSILMGKHALVESFAWARGCS